MLAAQLVGRGRPKVAFLHGLFGRGQNWNGIARALLDDELASVLLDLPNHGRSRWTDDFDYLAIADDVADFITERMGWAASLTLVGHSMGGKVAMLVALRHPELVKSLVVVDIAPDRSDQIVTSIPLVAAMRALDLAAIGSRGDADQAMSARVPDPAVRAFLLQNLRHVRHPGEGEPQWRWEQNLAMLGDSIDEVAAWPEVRGSYPGPVLWIAGGDSSYIREEHHQAMRALFPQVQLITIEGAGHWVHADQPDALIAELRDFLTTPRR